MFKGLKKLVDDLDFRNDPEGTLKRIQKLTEQRPNLARISGFDNAYELMTKLGRDAKTMGMSASAKNLLDSLHIGHEIYGTENIPDQGGNLYVANHRYGAVDGLMMVGDLAEQVLAKGRDFKVAGTYKLKIIPGIEESVFFVDRTSDTADNYDGYNGENLRPVRRIVQHLNKGRDLAMYPAAETSYSNGKDPFWKPALGKMLWKRAQNIVPMYFDGPRHGFWYTFLDNIKPSLRGLACFKELNNKRGKTVTLTIGRPISREELKRFGKDGVARTEFIQQACYDLKRR